MPPLSTLGYTRRMGVKRIAPRLLQVCNHHVAALAPRVNVGVGIGDARERVRPIDHRLERTGLR